MILTISTIALLASFTSTSAAVTKTIQAEQTPSFSKAELVEIISQEQKQQIQLDDFVVELPVATVYVLTRTANTKNVAQNKVRRLSDSNEHNADE